MRLAPEIAEESGELSVSAVRSRLHGSQRNPQLLGDLDVGHSVQMLHANDGCFVTLELVDRTTHVPYRVDCTEVGWQAHQRPVVRRDVGECTRGPAGLPPVDVDGGAFG